MITDGLRQRAPLLVAVVLAISPLGCSKDRDGQDGARESASSRDESARRVSFTKLDLPPVATFERACSPCHGPRGSFFGGTFGMLTEADLRKMVDAMMKGPGFLKPTAGETEAMIAYHRALAAEEPFLCVTRYRPAGGQGPAILAGEATPGAKVEHRTAGKAVPLSVEENGAWSVDDPDKPPFIFAARLGDKARTLRFPAEQWTHSRR